MSKISFPEDSALSSVSSGCSSHQNLLYSDERCGMSGPNALMWVSVSAVPIFIGCLLAIIVSRVKHRRDKKKVKLWLIMLTVVTGIMSLVFIFFTYIEPYEYKHRPICPNKVTTGVCED
jgi:cytochrome bd-type quinol oxidase subunit 2